MGISLRSQEARALRQGTRALLPLLAVVFLLLSASSAFAISRTTVLARAQSWIDVPVKYSQSKYFAAVSGDGKYRTDCSGFTSMAWRTRNSNGATSYTTRSLHGVSTKIKYVDLQPGDALVKYNYHARVFYGWVDESHTDYVCYEQTGPTSKSSIKNVLSDIASGYRAYRYDHLSADLPKWNLAVNPTFDVWVSSWNAPARGTLMWWDQFGGTWGASVSTRTTDLTRTGKSSLGLVNPSARPGDLVGVAQTAAVVPGKPYTFGAWVSTAADPAGVSMRLEFLDSTGHVLASEGTEGSDWQIDAAPLRKMSVTATAPAEAASATVSLRLAGGTDASGTAGTRAVIDDVTLFDSSPVSMTFALSATHVRRGHPVRLRGTVTSPLAIGTVRVYVVRPGRTNATVLADRPLVGGSWSMTSVPGYRGTYRYYAKYLGFGPYGSITSAKVPLIVR